MEAQFKDLKFKTAGDFNTWLIKTANKAIRLDSIAGDMQSIYIHESGEILHCDFHAQIYNGRFIDMENLFIGSPLGITDNDSDKYTVMERLIPTEIRDLTYLHIKSYENGK
jgi:hypothetical protein